MKAITKEEIQAFKATANPMQISHISDIFPELVAKFKKGPSAFIGLPTKRWPVFNSAYGGLREGELITLTADTGMGKTTFALNMLMDYLQQGIPCFLVSLEIPISHLSVLMSQLISKKHFDEMTPEDLGGVGEVLKGLPLFYLDMFGQIQERFLLKTIEYAGLAIGCKFAVIDHLDYILRQREEWQNESYVIGDSMRRLVAKTREAKLTTLLIVHPAKLGQHGVHRREVGMDELKGSSSIKQESDSVWGIHRPDPSKNMTTLRFLKIRNHRFGGHVGSKISFSFDRKTQELDEVSTGIEWED